MNKKLKMCCPYIQPLSGQTSLFLYWGENLGPNSVVLKLILVEHKQYTNFY